MGDTNFNSDDLTGLPKASEIPDDEFVRITKLLPTVMDTDKSLYFHVLLDYWCGYAIPNHVQMFQKTAPETIVRLSKTASAINSLNETINSLKEHDELTLGAMPLILKQTGSWRRSDIAEVSAEINKMLDFAMDIKNSINETVQKIRPKRGQRKNHFGHMIILDLAAIFKWATGKTPTRVYNDYQGKETGPFRAFADHIWKYVISEDGKGFDTSFRNWSDHKKEQSSPIVANFLMAIRTGYGG